MGTTGAPYNIPFPEGTDLVRDGDNAIRSTAEQTSTVIKALAGNGAGWGFRGGSSVISTDVNGLAVIPFATFVGDVGGLGCIPIAMNGDGFGTNIIVSSYAPQAFRQQWSVLVRQMDGNPPPINSGYRINWIVIGQAS